MKKRLLFSVLTFLLILATIAPAALAQGDTAAITVAVGIVPEAAFVQAVAGDLAEVITLVPSGYSPENYQPTATEMQALSDAAIYFTLQMPTEQAKIFPNAKDFNADLIIVDLREAAAAAYPLLQSAGDEEELAGGQDAHEHGGVDPHVWLSPKRAMVMVQAIADEFSAYDPANREFYQANAAAYIARLEALDGEIREKTAALTNKYFIIYHGSHGYFADDYGLKMVAIEIEGKQATAAQLQGVIDLAREYGIRTVFYQTEFDDNQAQTVAEEVGGTVAKVSPLSPDYIQSLEDFADALARSDD
jgi:zinc transport system substrate-binding protein